MLELMLILIFTILICGGYCVFTIFGIVGVIGFSSLIILWFCFMLDTR